MSNNVLLDIFAPYLPFILFFVSITINILVAVKFKVHWITLIVINVILSLIYNKLGLGDYDLITIVFEKIINLIIKPISDFFDNILPW